MDRENLSAKVTAKLLITVINHGKEKSKNITRARVSRKSFLKLSGRKRLRRAFLEEVRDCTADLGWTMIDVDKGFGLLQTHLARNWTKVSKNHVKDMRKDFRRGELSVDLLCLKEIYRGKAYEKD